MKDDERSQIFLKAFSDQEVEISRLQPEAQSTVKRIATQHHSELQPSAGLFFAEETELTISRQAGSKLAMKLLTSCSLPDSIASLNKDAIESSWQEVVAEFHRQNHWHLPTLDRKPAAPKKPLTRDQKIFREMFSYIWVFIQAALIMKIFVFYFGLNSAEDNSGYNTLFLVIALLFSAGSLGFFAYRKSKKS